VPLFRGEPFFFSMGVAHPCGQAGVGVRLREANQAVVHHPAVVVDTLTRRYTGKPDLSGAKRYSGAK
jgi:hypothetical protein